MRKPGNQAKSGSAYPGGAVDSPSAGGNSVWANPGQTSNMFLVPNNTPSGNSHTDKGLVFFRNMKKLRQHHQLEEVGCQDILLFCLSRAQVYHPHQSVGSLALISSTMLGGCVRLEETLHFWQTGHWNNSYYFLQDQFLRFLFYVH